MDWNDRENKRLIQAILELRNAGEARGFLRDLMTTKEIEEFGKRLQAAELLSEDVPYTTIEKETGLSSTTIARVSKWLSNGMGGYKSVIKKLHRHSSSGAKGD